MSELESELDRWREGAAMASAVLAYAPLGIEVFDAEGYVEWMNDKMVEFLGLRDAEAVLGKFNVLTDAVALESGLADQARRAYAGEVVENPAFEIDLQSGAERWTSSKRTACFSHILFPVADSRGRVRRVIAILQDVTEHVRTREAVVTAQRHQGLAVLAGSVAHDFNNLLSVILGNVGLALHEGPPDRVGEALQDISEAAETASSLTRQLMAYAGNAQLVFETLDVGEQVRAIAQLMQSAVSKKVSLAVEGVEDSLPVRGDRTQIRQVLLNLVKNASDAVGPRAGTIRLATRRAHVPAPILRGLAGSERLRAGEYVQIEVSDDGAGMSAETMARLFEPFYSTKGPGRGLGMAATLSILQRHGGGIAMDSVLGRGSTFRVYLPVSYQRTTVRPVIPPRVEPRSGGTILVVDDEPHLRRLARKMLQSRGHEVLLAADGREGVRCFREHVDGIDLVLLDLSMPELGGGETLARLRAIRPDVKVVLCSGHQPESIAGEIDAEDVDGFLHKPYRLEELMGEVDRVLRLGS